MRSVVLIPGAAPHWVDDHARHLAQRLTASGRVMVVFTHDAHHHTEMPGRPGNGSVLGHSVAGYPIWTGRLRAALGIRRSAAAVVMVLWPGANRLLALWAASMARLRGERVVLDVPAHPPSAHRSMLDRIIDPALERLADEVVEGPANDFAHDNVRTILALCGDDETLARLVVQTFEGMSADAARSWRLRVQISHELPGLVRPGGRRDGQIEVLDGEPSLEALREADVLIGAFDSPFEGLVHQAVLSGGAGVVVGQPVAGRVARCHDGVWLAQRNSASILVALEASSGAMFARPASVATMRRIADEVLHVVEHELAEVGG